MNEAQKIYDETYRDRYLAQSQTPLGKAIYYSRWALILKYLQGGTVLDYGCGPGAFNSCGPESFKRFNYDINPTCGFTERVWTGANKWPITALTMWDSIEHVPNFYGEIKEINADWLFISTPNLESVIEPVMFFRHYRPKEHIYYFDRHSLGVILEDLGYEIKEMNFDEGKLRNPNRPDAILTVVAKRRQGM